MRLGSKMYVTCCNISRECLINLCAVAAAAASCSNDLAPSHFPITIRTGTYTHGTIALTHSIFWSFLFYFIFVYFVCDFVFVRLTLPQHALHSAHWRKQFLVLSMCLHIARHSTHKYMSTQLPLIYYVKRFWGKISDFAWLVCTLHVCVQYLSLFLVRSKCIYESLWLLLYTLGFFLFFFSYSRVECARARPNPCNRPWELDH